MIEIVSSSSSSQLSGCTGDAAARKSSYGSPEAPVSSTRITSMPDRSSGSTSSASSASSRSVRVPEWRRMYSDLRAREPRVDRDEDPPCGRNAEVRLQHRRAVGEERRDPVALLETGCAQSVGEAPGALAELRVGVAARSVDDGDLLRVHVGGAGEQVDRGQLRAKDLGGHPSMIERRARVGKRAGHGGLLAMIRRARP